MLAFATFWAGERPSALELACLMSVVRYGYSVKLYAFSEMGPLPAGVELADASAIVSEADMKEFLISGEPSLSHFSDWFRYQLFAKTDCIWIDADMLLLKPLDTDFDGQLLARERGDSLCGAIMRLDRADPRLGKLINKTRSLMGRNLRWGETGPRLITETFGREVFEKSYPATEFFPIGHDDFWKVLVPSERAWCERACTNSRGVHLWNNILERTGFWKDLLPPTASWLHDRLKEIGATDLFGPAYPEKVIERTIQNWHLRKTGAELGVGAVARQLLPSVLRTWRHRPR